MLYNTRHIDVALDQWLGKIQTEKLLVINRLLLRQSKVYFLRKKTQMLFGPTCILPGLSI